MAHPGVVSCHVGEPNKQNDLGCRRCSNVGRFDLDPRSQDVQTPGSTFDSSTAGNRTRTHMVSTSFLLCTSSKWMENRARVRDRYLDPFGRRREEKRCNNREMHWTSQSNSPRNSQTWSRLGQAGSVVRAKVDLNSTRRVALSTVDLLGLSLTQPCSVSESWYERVRGVAVPPHPLMDNRG
jgi:hypothetical protein